MATDQTVLKIDPNSPRGYGVCAYCGASAGWFKGRFGVDRVCHHNMDPGDPTKCPTSGWPVESLLTEVETALISVKPGDELACGVTRLAGGNLSTEVDGQSPPRAASSESGVDKKSGTEVQ